MSDHLHHAATHVRKYIVIYLVLLVLRVVTVGVSLFHLPIGAAVALALIVASIKGALVGLYFMHLKEETNLVYAVLGLTFALFLHLLLLPVFTFEDNISDRDDKVKLGYDYVP